MWAVTNRRAFNADRCFARDADGAEVWIVAVRGIFSIDPDGRVKVAEKQEEIRLAPEYFGESARSSVRYEMDLVRTKPGTDVVVHGHAHAPGSRPTPVVAVRLTIGSVSKTLRVFGDRVWEQGLLSRSPGEPQPFISIPIRHERAWGGKRADSDACDPWNPVGVGADAVPDKPVPNIELPDSPFRSPKHKDPPAGFGPIPCDWQPRVKLAGTYDDVWQKERQPLVPKDFQDAYFRCAPVDQQVDGFLKGGEVVVLRNLTAEGILRFRSPRVVLGFSTRFDEGTTHRVGQFHTIIIEPEARRLIMDWQTALPCHHTLYTLRETVAIEKQLVPLGARETHASAPVARQ